MPRSTWPPTTWRLGPHASGPHGLAYALVRAALDGARARGSRTDETRVLDELALLADEQGDPAAAERHREEARRLRERAAGIPAGGGPAEGPGGHSS